VQPRKSQIPLPYRSSFGFIPLLFPRRRGGTFSFLFLVVRRLCLSTRSPPKGVSSVFPQAYGFPFSKLAVSSLFQNLSPDLYRRARSPLSLPCPRPPDRKQTNLVDGGQPPPFPLRYGFSSIRHRKGRHRVLFREDGAGCRPFRLAAPVFSRRPGRESSFEQDRFCPEFSFAALPILIRACKIRDLADFPPPSS